MAHRLFCGTLSVSADSQNRQFQQLNALRKERATVHVYLLSGTRFTGRIRSFDVHTILLETQSGDMVIYGHAVSTIEPAPLGRGRRLAGGGENRPVSARSEPAGSPRGLVLSRADGVSGRAAGLQPDRCVREVNPQTGAGGRSAPGAPTVTIVRRRSRSVPKTEDV